MSRHLKEKHTKNIISGNPRYMIFQKPKLNSVRQHESERLSESVWGLGEPWSVSTMSVCVCHASLPQMTNAECDIKLPESIQVAVVKQHLPNTSIDFQFLQHCRSVRSKLLTWKLIWCICMYATLPWPWPLLGQILFLARHVLSAIYDITCRNA